MLVEVLAPHQRRVYDPCCGSGGMFVRTQAVTRVGDEVTVLTSVEEWRRLQGAAQPSLEALILVDEARHESSH